MSTIIQGAELRSLVMGRYVTGKQQDITTGGAATYQLFTVAGGEVLITALWAVVDTAITVANTINVQADPTTGDTVVCGTATDLGTTDTAAGTTIAFQFDQDGTTNTPSLVKGCGEPLRLVATTGEIESVVTGTNPDGVVDWYAMYVPLTPGATLAASA